MAYFPYWYAPLSDAAMANPAGETTGDVLRLDFDLHLMVQFRGLLATSDADLLAYRELDDALGLSAMMGEALADVRTGKMDVMRLSAYCGSPYSGVSRDMRK